MKNIFFALFLTAFSMLLMPYHADAKTSLPQEISQADWDKARQYVQLPTGIKMSYVEMGNPDGPVMILQHGMTDNNRVWSLSAPIFAKAGYHIYMTDLRGHGYSDQPDGFYTVPQFATDIKAFMDVKGIKKAIMIGHSLGSMTMQAFLLMFPERCERVVLVATAPVDKRLHRPEAFAKFKSMGANGHPSDEFINTWYANENPVPEDFLKHIKKEAQQLSSKAWANIFGGLSSSTLEDLYPYFDKSIPMLILFGEKDALLKGKQQEDILKHFPTAESKTYKGIGHNIQYEIPDQFANDVIIWLKKVENKKSISK